MTGTNERTLAAYQMHVPEYVAGTGQVVSGATKDWLDAALDSLPRDASVLEIGSAFGRDARYIQEQGYAVECTDAAPAFVDYLGGIGLKARHLNILTDALDPGYDLILANAVLLHFDRTEFLQVLTKVAGALYPGGRFAFSLKRGDGEDWSDAKLHAPRYFCYWQPAALPVLLSQAGFSRLTVDAVTTERAHSDWIYVIASV